LLDDTGTRSFLVAASGRRPRPARPRQTATVFRHRPGLLSRWARPHSVSRLLENIRYEVIPTDAVEEHLLRIVPIDVTVTITSSPTKGLEPTLRLAEHLSGHGYNAVPHVAARLVRDAPHLLDIVARLQEAGVEELFVPAGDVDPPAGIYDKALPVLVELAGLPSRFARVGITGYPERHPSIGDEVTYRSMLEKSPYADYIVSNLTFDARAVGGWIRQVRACGVDLPVHVGLAGPVERTRLIEIARRIGVNESARFARKHLGWMTRLAAPAGYRPDRLLESLEPVFADPDSGVAGLHVFTFNQLERTEAWRQKHLVFS
jgi:methylenetetrahydrofolate reductase (NADPH)